MSAPQTHLAQPPAAPGASGARQAARLTLPPRSIAPCPWPLPLPPQSCCQPASCLTPPPPQPQAFPPPETPLPARGQWGTVGSALSAALVGLSSSPAPWHGSWVHPHAAMGAKPRLPEPPRRCRRVQPQPMVPRASRPLQPTMSMLWCPRWWSEDRGGTRRDELPRGLSRSVARSLLAPETDALLTHRLFGSGCESSYTTYEQLLTQCIFLSLPLSLYEKGPRTCQRNFP